MVFSSKQAGILAAALLLAIQVVGAHADKIAFYANRDGNMDVYTMNIDGTGLVNLTNHPAADGPDDQQVGRPAWSPDGNKIAFTSNRDGNSEVYVMDADGTNQLNLSLNPTHDSLPSWSPDGNKIAFRSDRGGYADIWIMDADGTNPVHLLGLDDNTEWNLAPNWSPDGTKFVFSKKRKDKDDSDIWVVNADGTDAVNIYADAAWDFDPVWSPDGSQIAFLSGQEGIMLTNADGTNPTRVVLGGSDGVWVFWCDWSPDGRQLAITYQTWNPTTNSPRYRIALISLDNLSAPQPLMLTDNGFNSLWPDWAPSSVTTTAIKAHSWGRIKAQWR